MATRVTPITEARSFAARKEPRSGRISVLLLLPVVILLIIGLGALLSASSVLAIREGNLIFTDGKTFVDLMVGEQQFERREVQTGLSDGINIEVLDGLAEGDQIKKL